MDAVDAVENTPLDGLHGGELAYLIEHFSHRLVHRRGGLAVTRVVGHIVLPTGRVLRIRSEKAPTTALLAWMEYADPGLASLDLGRLVPDIATDGDHAALLVEVYARALLQACARVGLVRTYRPVQTCSAVVRGRIDFHRMVTRAHDLSRLPCNSWERAADTPLNRFLAAALAHIDRDPQLRGFRSTAITRARQCFIGVSPHLSDALRRGAQPLARGEVPFAPAYALARLLLHGYGISDGASLPGIAFLIDLERLFERAVQRSFIATDRASKTGVELTFSHQVGTDAGLGRMRLDLLARTPDGPLVVDAKFKHHVSAANLQQMVTYCHLTGAARAVLVLPGPIERRESFCFAGPARQDIVVDVRGLDTTARTLGDWQRNGAALVAACQAP